MIKIMVVEDDFNTGKLMETILKKHGYEPILARDGLEALDSLEKHNVNLIIADAMMPRMDGYELTKLLREVGDQVPILMVTAKEEVSDKIQGFMTGVDDYMVKPVNEKEMILRIAALLRRSKIANDHRLVIGKTELDYDEMLIIQEGEEIKLPKKEFQLLFKLLSYPNKIFTRHQLIDDIWGLESESSGKTVNVHINRLRDRFKENKDFELITVRGVGYKAVIK